MPIRLLLIVGILLVSALVALPQEAAAPRVLTPTPLPGTGSDLSEDEIATLNSLAQVDDYPLYTMHYYGDNVHDPSPASVAEQNFVGANSPAWGCSLFAALADEESRLYGRNFDWEYSPALLLFTHPTDGYDSVSMVGIAYVGFPGSSAAGITTLSLDERQPLLAAPYLPFDGMNERGLAVGVAAVPSADMTMDPGKETIGSLRVIREMLDHAATVPEAVAIIQTYNLDMTGGPPLHYLIADATGQAVLVEFSQGNMVLIPNAHPWHLATNFLLAEAGDAPSGLCWRYDALSERLAQSAGLLTAPEALRLLDAVSQPDSTQWSIVYGLMSGEIRVVMGQSYEQVYTFQLDPENATAADTGFESGQISLASDCDSHFESYLIKPDGK
jgi:hypothetical protein